MSKLTIEERNRINVAVAAAEAKTTAEIVPVIVESSGRYNRAEDAWGISMAVIFLLIVDLLVIPRLFPHGDWQVPMLWTVSLQLLAIFLGVVTGTLLSNRIPSLRSLFISRGELSAEVVSRAKQIFFDQRIHHTDSHSGVLVYISLFERKAVVLSDETVLQTLGQPFIDNWCADLTRRLKSGNVIDALEQTINQIGQDLANALPGTTVDRNELPDALITSGPL